MIRFSALICACFITVSAWAQNDDHAMEFWLWPDYTLDRNAKNQIGPRLPLPDSPSYPLDVKTYPFVFFGKDPSERLEDFIPLDQLPQEEFTVEMWILNHVNRDVGAFVALRDKYSPTDPSWLLGFYGKEVLFSHLSSSGLSNAITHTIEERGWKKYWYHLAVSVTPTQTKLYLNGNEINTLEMKGFPGKVEAAEIELAAYLSNEPYMQTGDLVKALRISSTALTETDIRAQFRKLQQLVEEGALYPDLFHYSAGPYLQMADHGEIGMVWETNLQSRASIQYGESLPLRQATPIEKLSSEQEVEASPKNIHQLMLKDLKPGATYFYNIISESENGEVIESGISTFKVPSREVKSFSFGVIGDTEARPHVNNRVSKLLWDERPDFLMNLGDLTDGGKELNKFEWNYEYFYGMNQLISRIPVYPVAGNGEGDLYWFKKYHILPEDKGYYKFSYGNADFFMLDSNQKEEFAPGGAQYQWLEKELSQSDATWKFVAHHHAPYSSDENDYGDSWKGKSALGDPKIKKIVPLYEKYNVDVVFFGHLHTYQRTHHLSNESVSQSNGVIYIQAGGAGGNLEDFAPTRSWFSAKTFRGHHYVMIEVLGDAMELRMYDSEGRMKDLHTYQK